MVMYAVVPHFENRLSGLPGIRETDNPHNTISIITALYAET